PVPSRSSPSHTRSSLILFSSCFFRGSGTFATVTTMSRQPTSSAAGSATAGSRLATAIAGIIATLPYIALQLVGLQVVIGGIGNLGAGYAGDLPLVIAFIILAAFTYSSGLRAPASIAIVKDILIYLTAFAAIIVVPIQLGGFEKIFAAVPASKLLLAVPGP